MTASASSDLEMQLTVNDVCQKAVNLTTADVYAANLEGQIVY